MACGVIYLCTSYDDHVQPFLIDNLGNVPIIGFLFQGYPLGIGVLQLDSFGDNGYSFYGRSYERRVEI